MINCYVVGMSSLCSSYLRFSAKLVDVSECGLVYVWIRVQSKSPSLVVPGIVNGPSPSLYFGDDRDSWRAEKSNLKWNFVHRE